MVKFGFEDNISPNLYIDILSKLSAPEVSIHKNYKIPIVFVLMDEDIKYGNTNISALKDDNGIAIKNVIAFGEQSFGIGRKSKRIQVPLEIAFARTVHSAQGITAKQSLVFTPTKENERIFAPFLAYVALSRVGSLKQLLLLELLTVKHFSINYNLRVSIEKEYNRLRKIINIF